jgi:abequosyltransferase
MKTNTSADNLPLLTIAIPTYNRAAKLDKCLAQIFEQLDTNDGRVEVLVSDNCSPDHTGEIVSKHIREGRKIRYIKNRENMGIDFNVSQCYKEASGKFAVAFGDDDTLLDGGINLILKAIQDHPDAGAIHLNAYRAKHKEGAVIPFKDPVEFIKEMHYDVTFISANIINTNLIDWDNLLTYRGTFLNHVHLLYEAIFQAPVNVS